jgi:hypothetical protein
LNALLRTLNNAPDHAIEKNGPKIPNDFIPLFALATMFPLASLLTGFTAYSKPYTCLGAIYCGNLSINCRQISVHI